MWNQFKNTQWDWSNLYFRFPRVFSHIPTSLVFGYRQSGAHPRKMSWKIFLTEDKNHEDSPAGSIKRTQVVYMALFSCQERCLWKWHAFHRKLWDSKACLAPRRHTDSQVLFISQGTIICLVIPSEIFIDFLLYSSHCFKFEEYKHNTNSYDLLSSNDVIQILFYSLSFKPYNNQFTDEKLHLRELK